MNKKITKFNYSIATSAGIRPVNEDAGDVCINRSGQLLAIVCDGIGSSYGSDFASKFIVEFFKNKFQKARRIYHVNAWFNRTLKSAYVGLREATKDKGQLGTTLVMAIITGKKAQVFNIGDSRLYHYNSTDHQWNRVTNDHNLFNFLEKNKAPQSLFLRNKNALLALTNYIDSKTDKHMTSTNYNVDLTHGDFVLLASDGFYNFVKPDVITNIIAYNRKQGFDKMSGLLVDEAIKNASNDNLTVILIELQDPAERKVG